MTISTYRKATAAVVAVIVAAMVLIIPQTSRAAFDDVNLTTSTVIAVGAINLVVAGDADAVESMSVTSTTVSFTLEAGSTVLLTSAARAAFTSDAPSNMLSSQQCTDSLSNFGLTALSNASQTTVTVTPSQTSTCTTIGGGGGGGSTTTTATTTTDTNTATTTAATTTTQTTDQTPTQTQTQTTDADAAVRAQLQTQITQLMAQLNALLAARGLPAVTGNTGTNASASVSFDRDLQVGSTGEDVMALQQWLNANGYMVAESGPGSPGNETTMYGRATKAAVAKYQEAMGISPAAGYFGPKTRASINSN